MIPGKAYSVEQIVGIAWRRRWLFAGAVILGGALGYAATLMMPKLYRSEAVILVVPQRVPERLIATVVAARLEDRVKTVGQEILGQTWLTRIVEEYNLYPELRRTRGIEQAVTRMRMVDAKINFVKADAFSVSYVSEDPQLAYQVTARLASDFVAQNLKDRSLTAEATNSLLQEALDEKKKQLTESERRLEQYRLRYSGELPTQMPANQQALQGLQMQVQTIADSINQLRNQRLIHQRALADLESSSEGPVLDPMAAPGAAALDPLLAQIAEAQTNLRNLQSRYKDTHPDVSAARRRLRELEDKYQGQRDTTAPATAGVPAPPVSFAERTRVNRIRQIRGEMDTLDTQIEVKVAEEKRLRGVLGDVQRRIDASPTRETELIALTRDYDTLKGMYANLLERLEAAKLAEKVENGEVGQQFRVIDPPLVPNAPFSPSVRRFVGVGAATALFLSCLLVAFLEYRDATLKTEEDVLSCVGLPVIAVIPVMTRTVAPAPARRLRRLLPWSGTAALLIAAAAWLAIF